MTTITLQVDDDLLARAGELAAARQLTVVEVFQRLLRIAMQPALRREELPPLTLQTQGILPPETDEQTKLALDEYRTQKYGA